MTTTRSRIRDLGIIPGDLPTGPHNAITDVPGVRVGHTTLHDGTRFHTGVTAIVPDALAARKAIPTGLFVGNGYGKLIGATQLAELGEIETPIVLTGTLSAFRAADALVSWMLDQPGNEEMRSVSPVVGETNDGQLSDIRARPITEKMVRDALDTAASGPVAEGCVGAGAGTVALGFKAGIGTSSRRVTPHVGEDLVSSRTGDQRDFTIGAIVQANYTGTLTVLGVPIDANDALEAARAPDEDASGPGSCMIILATDAPLDSRQLDRISRRALFAMGRTGADFTHGSGDYALTLATGQGNRIPDADLDPFFAATMDCVEEALLNSLFKAETTHGHRGTRHAVPIDHVLDRLREHNTLV